VKTLLIQPSGIDPLILDFWTETTFTQKDNTEPTERTNDMNDKKIEMIQKKIDELEKEIEIEEIESKSKIFNLECQKVELIRLLPDDEFEDLED